MSGTHRTFAPSVESMPEVVASPGCLLVRKFDLLNCFGQVGRIVQSVGEVTFYEPLCTSVHDHIEVNEEV
jgi:hypothetical protein